MHHHGHQPERWIKPVRIKKVEMRNLKIISGTKVPIIPVMKELHGALEQVISESQVNSLGRITGGFETMIKVMRRFVRCRSMLRQRLHQIESTEGLRTTGTSLARILARTLQDLPKFLEAAEAYDKRWQMGQIAFLRHLPFAYSAGHNRLLFNM